MRQSTAGLVYRKRSPREFGGSNVYVTPRSDMRVLYPGYRSCAFDLMLVAERFVIPGATVWDIGSNLGIFATLAAYRAGRNGRAFAVEADPRYAYLQQKTFAQLGAEYAPVVGLCAAVSDTVGVASFAVSELGHARSHLASVRETQTESIKQVPTVTLDFLLGFWPQPDVVKIDIEGAEHLAIAGAVKLLTNVRPLIYIEISDANRHALAKLFRQYDYSLNHLKGDGGLEPIDEGHMYTIALPKERSAADQDRLSP